MRATVFALVFVTAAAQARPKPAEVREAERRFQGANALYGEGHYTDALQLYQAAYDLVASPSILLNIGLTKEKVFDYEGCALALRQFLRESTDAGRIDQAKKRLEVCRARALIPVKVSSMPPSAAVIVTQNGERRPRGRTPTRLDLAPGRYTITVEAPGYLPETQEVNAEEGVHPDVDFTLEKLSSLRIEADVSGADVSLDGAPVGPAPLQTEVKAGLYHVQVTHEGYRSAVRDVRVNAGDQVSLMVSLAVLPRERRLRVDLKRPAAAQVVLDGVPSGVAPMELKVPSGSHHIEVESPGHLPYAGEVHVPDQRDLHLRVRLTPKRTRRQWLIFGFVETAALAALGVSVGYDALTAQAQSQFDRRPTLELRTQGEAHATVADVMLGVSVAVGLGGAVYMLATLPRPSRAEVQ